MSRVNLLCKECGRVVSAVLLLLGDETYAYASCTVCMPCICSGVLTVLLFSCLFGRIGL